MHFAQWTTENGSGNSRRTLEPEYHAVSASKPSFVRMRRRSRKSASHRLTSVSEDGSVRSRESQQTQDGSVRSRESQQTSELSRASKSKGKSREGRRSTKRRGKYPRGENTENTDNTDTISMVPCDGYSADASQEVSRRSCGLSGLSESPMTMRRFDRRLDGFQEDMRELVRQSFE